MNIISSKIVDHKVIIRLKDRVCETPEELLVSELFVRIFHHVLSNLGRRQSRLLDMFPEPNLSRCPAACMPPPSQYLQADCCRNRSRRHHRSTGKQITVRI